MKCNEHLRVIVWEPDEEQARALFDDHEESRIRVSRSLLAHRPYKWRRSGSDKLCPKGGEQKGENVTVTDVDQLLEQYLQAPPSNIVAEESGRKDAQEKDDEGDEHTVVTQLLDAHDLVKNEQGRAGSDGAPQVNPGDRLNMEGGGEIDSAIVVVTLELDLDGRGRKGKHTRGVNGHTMGCPCVCFPI